MPWEAKGGLARWTMDMRGNSDEISERPLDPPGDMRAFPTRCRGRPLPHRFLLQRQSAGRPTDLHWSRRDDVQLPVPDRPGDRQGWT